MALNGWAEQDQTLVSLVNDYHSRCVEVYRRDLNRIEEDAGKERGIAEGGYGRKQIQELIQNAADALQGHKGRVQVVLTADALYVANEGAPFVDSGVRALLYTHMSDKSGAEIGRFGLGFKSISGISDSPKIYSRSVSFEFSRELTARELSAELDRPFAPADVPALRVAWSVDPLIEFRSDPILGELSGWAVTIVKIPLKAGAAAQLSEEMDDFDETFCLFAPHVHQLDLRDDLTGADKSFRASKKGNKVTLRTADGAREWLVVSKLHRPSEAALDSAGYAARRETVTVSWAVPLDGRAGIGQLTAFFPVKSELTLSGRVNAPWKLSDDRINVIECLFNSEILDQVVPQLVVAARRDLASRGFGRYIDLLPARGKEERSWADGRINEPIYEALRNERCLPDLDGNLRSPGSLKRIPEAVSELANQWLAVAGDRGEWVHPDCTTSTERRSKVDRLMGQSSAKVGRVLHWLQAVVENPEARHSAEAVKLASVLIEHGGNVSSDVRDAKIILLENGTLQRPVQGLCFIRSDAAQDGTSFIDPAVTVDPSALAALEHLGITGFEDGGEMLQLLTQLKNTGKVDWDALWSAMRGSGELRVSEAFDSVLRGMAHRLIRVRNGLGHWVHVDGHYVPGDSLHPLKEDGAFLVDTSYHSADIELLALLGIRGRPFSSPSRGPEKWLSFYVKEVKEAVAPEMGLGPVQREQVEIDSLDTVLGPIECLPELSVTNKTAMTEAILNGVYVPRVRVTHPRVSRPAQFVAPELWWVRKHGIIRTTLGQVRVGEAFVSAVEETEFRGLLPAVTGLDLSRDTEDCIGLRRTIGDLTPSEFKQLARIHVDRDDDEKVGLVYAWWCEVNYESAPERLWAREGGVWVELPRTDIAIVTSKESANELSAFSIPSVLVGTEDVTNLRELWGCIEGPQLPITYSYETSAEPEALLDIFETLDTLDLDEDPEDLDLQKCLSISKVAAVPGKPEVRVSCESAREENRILVTGDSDRAILKQVLGCLKFDDSDEQVEALLRDMEKRRNSKQVRAIRNAATDEARLLQFVGEERLRALVPKDAMTFLGHSAEGEPRGEELANLCITMLGVRALERACKIEPQGLLAKPPSNWHGSYAARLWVDRLGFGEEWAGAKSRRKNKPTEYVDGPIQLGELHDYQKVVSARLKALLAGEGPQRAIISLPTGAGKTRVAVQSVIEAIRDDGIPTRTAGSEFTGPILWLTDGEELCEQAIDAWSYLWRAVGRDDTQLILSRFWKNYEMEEEVGGVQVVVANWQKIKRNALDNENFDWLKDAPIVIVDEAHSALHKSYTRIFEWLGRSKSQRDKPFIGLTATPFRGRRESDETKRLLARFDNNLLDHGVFGSELPQLRLQRDGVLAKANLEILNGASIRLGKDDLETFISKAWLPTSAAKTLGANEDRTRTIVNSIVGKPDDWRIVVFAASVEAAQTLATLLTIKGRPAASIDQDTSPDDRRSAISRFKSGELKILTNYNVLSQGFDAPMTDAVYITRPTSSEVRYMQMIGRGLRGKANGGTDEVLIVNLIDNIAEFGESIVYEGFQEIIDSNNGVASDRA